MAKRPLLLVKVFAGFTARSPWSRSARIITQPLCYVTGTTIHPNYGTHYSITVAEGPFRGWTSTVSADVCKTIHPLILLAQCADSD